MLLDHFPKMIQVRVGVRHINKEAAIRAWKLKGDLVNCQKLGRESSADPEIYAECAGKFIDGGVPPGRVRRAGRGPGVRAAAAGPRARAAGLDAHHGGATVRPPHRMPAQPPAAPGVTTAAY